jgi:hypothetical protein
MVSCPRVVNEEVSPTDLVVASSKPYLAFLESDGGKVTRSLRFPLDWRSRRGRMEQREAGEMADAGDRLTGGVMC